MNASTPILLEPGDELKFRLGILFAPPQRACIWLSLFSDGHYHLRHWYNNRSDEMYLQAEVQLRTIALFRDYWIELQHACRRHNHPRHLNRSPVLERDGTVNLEFSGTGAMDKGPAFIWKPRYDHDENTGDAGTVLDAKAASAFFGAP